MYAYILALSRSFAKYTPPLAAHDVRQTQTDRAHGKHVPAEGSSDSKQADSMHTLNSSKGEGSSPQALHRLDQAGHHTPCHSQQASDHASCYDE